jgi:hypothetical protein
MIVRLAIEKLNVQFYFGETRLKPAAQFGVFWCEFTGLN